MRSVIRFSVALATQSLIACIVSKVCRSTDLTCGLKRSFTFASNVGCSLADRSHQSEFAIFKVIEGGRLEESFIPGKKTSRESVLGLNPTTRLSSSALVPLQPA